MNKKIAIGIYYGINSEKYFLFIATAAENGSIATKRGGLEQTLGGFIDYILINVRKIIFVVNVYKFI